MTLPWERDFKPPAFDENLVNQVTGIIQGATEAVTGVASQTAGAVGGPAAQQVVEDIGQAVTSVEKAGGGLISGLPVNSVPSGAPGGGDVVGGVIQQIEKAAAQTAAAAAAAALPALENRLAAAAAASLKKELESALGTGEPPLASISKKDLTKVDAWERAARTFGMGLVVTILGAIVQVLGQLATDGTSIDWFHKDGWTAVATLAVTAVVTSVFSYILRYIKEPVGAAVDSSKPTPES